MIGAPNSLILHCKVRVMKEAPGPSVSEEIADIFCNCNIDNDDNISDDDVDVGDGGGGGGGGGVGGGGDGDGDDDDHVIITIRIIISPNVLGTPNARHPVRMSPVRILYYRMQLLSASLYSDVPPLDCFRAPSNSTVREQCEIDHDQWETGNSLFVAKPVRRANVKKWGIYTQFASFYVILDRRNTVLKCK